jgi:hypothetical protein
MQKLSSTEYCHLIISSSQNQTNKDENCWFVICNLLAWYKNQIGEENILSSMYCLQFSPFNLILRYSDILVHRLLAVAIGAVPSFPQMFNKQNTQVKKSVFWSPGQMSMRVDESWNSLAFDRQLSSTVINSRRLWTCSNFDKSWWKSVRVWPIMYISDYSQLSSNVPYRYCILWRSMAAYRLISHACGE